uniref:HELP domain-containing protein n=1 Tax=Latimeria chalumnae TaxID=7897 RepID=H3BEE3_LATCH
PDYQLQLEWVYGYRGIDCHSNLFATKAGELVYFAGCIAVVYSAETKTQKHYCEHTAEIKSLALHPNKEIVATGQGEKSGEVMRQAHIRVWHTLTLQTLHVVGKKTFMSPIICLDFSQSLNHLVSIENNMNHVMCVWNFRTGKRVAKCNTTHHHQATKIICVRFALKNPNILVTGGKNHLTWWEIKEEKGRIEETMKADYQRNIQPKYVTCMHYSSKEDLITGDSNGTVYVWPKEGNTISYLIKHAHDAPVMSVYLQEDMMITSARDDNVFAWSWGKNVKYLGSLKIPTSEGGVCQTAVIGNILYMGTLHGSILQTEILTGHSNAIQAVTVGIKPTDGKNHLFLTAGFDGAMHVFDALEKKCLVRHYFQKTVIRCIDICPPKNLIALSTKNCEVIVLHISMQGNPCTVREEASPLHLRFSPCGNKLALACTNNIIYVVQLRLTDGQKEMHIARILKGHTSKVTGLDWSAHKVIDRHYILRSSSGTGEYMVWNTESGQQVQNSLFLKTSTWISETCTTGFEKKGRLVTECKNLSSFFFSKYNLILAVGTESGKILMFRHPCLTSRAECNTYGFGNGTAALRFIAGGERLVMAGGTDCLLTQWKLT